MYTASDQERGARAFSTDTLQHIERSFEASGTVVLREVFDRAFIEHLHWCFVGQYRQVYEDPKRRRVENVGDRRNLTVVEVEGAFNDPELYANPFAHGALAHLLGKDCIVGQYGSVTSLPGAAHQKPHRDSPWLFGRPETDVSVPPYAITVVIPLVDMHVEGPGTTRVWPRTHRVPSDDDAAAMPHFDPVVPRGSCLFMDSRLRHGGTANCSRESRPIIYMSYQRHWFRDYDGYRVKPPIHISRGELARVPPPYRHLFSWAQADNTPETLDLAIKRAAKKAVPEPVKAALRRLRKSMGRER
jgi:hypothetical protein